MSTFLKRAAMGLALLLSLVSFTPRSAFAYVSRADLVNNQRNLDRLSDKSGSLENLVGELQGFRVFYASGAIIGSTISVPGILPTDTIEEVVVYSSACDFAGSTVIGGRPGEAQINLMSRVCGINSMRLNATFTRKGTADISSQTLTINTTGWSFEVKLATGDGFRSGDGNIVLSSGNAICNAINSHPWLGRIVLCSTVGAANTFSTSTLSVESFQNAYTTQWFWSGTLPTGDGGTAGYILRKTTGAYALQTYSLPGSAITILSSGTVTVSSAAFSPSTPGGTATGMNSPIQPADALEIKTRGYRATQ